MSSTSSLAEIECAVEAFLPEAVNTLGRLNAVHVFQVAISLAPSVIKVCIGVYCTSFGDGRRDILHSCRYISYLCVIYTYFYFLAFLFLSYRFCPA